MICDYQTNKVYLAEGIKGYPKVAEGLGQRRRNSRSWSMCLISLGVLVTVAKVWVQIAKTRQSAKMLQFVMAGRPHLFNIKQTIF